jgi:hypothetical protein
MNTITSSEPAINDEATDQYDLFLEAISNQFAETTKSETHLFNTDASGLFDLFLNNLPPQRKQHYTCNSCKRFFEKFGGLVTIAEDGSTKPAIWNVDSTPDFFKASIKAVYRAVASAKVTNVFVSDEQNYGVKINRCQKLGENGYWRHIAVTVPATLVFKKRALSTPDSAIAEKTQEFEMLQRALSEYPVEPVRQAHALLTGGNLYRSEKCIGVAKWLLNIHEAIVENKGKRNNVIWRAVASAPTGFAHIKSGMIGTLLDDVIAGLEFADIKRKFDDKMNPLQYQRPQAPPKAGNIAQAEKIVAELESAGALARRFAKLEDIQKLWEPRKQDQPKAEGVFGHLLTKPQPQNISQPAVTMTWEKFRKTVLPTAEKIEYQVESRTASYVGLVTAKNMEATPILQWDLEENRNPMSWYMYSQGSYPSHWNLSVGWAEVMAVTLKPSMWGDEEKFAHQGKGVVFILDKAWDTKYESGAGFFPETLKSEYHEIRATMEAYMRRDVVEGHREATACGIALFSSAANTNWNQTFRVAEKGVQKLFKLDRWD